MDSVLAGLQWNSCLVYADDIIIPGNLNSVLFHLHTRMWKSVNLIIHCSRHSKSRHLAYTYLLTRCSAVPGPMRNYYRRFIKNFADIAKPLHRLTEKTATLSWSESYQSAIESQHQSWHYLTTLDHFYRTQMLVTQGLVPFCPKSNGSTTSRNLKDSWTNG